MRKFSLHFGYALVLGSALSANAQINLVQDYQNNTAAPIGTYQGINFKEGGFSALYPIAGTNGKEFWVCSDRGVNIDAANANSSSCRPTYDKIYPFPAYAPKIHRIKLEGDSIQILRTITFKRPDFTGATGVINPTGFGSTATEIASTDTVQNCANFNTKTYPKDIWGIDPEGLVVDADGNFYASEEGGPTIWKLDRNGKVTKRYSPYANLAGAHSLDVQIDTVFKYRKNNRGFESMAITPNGKIYTIIQSPLLYPTKTVGESTRIHRILEIDPATNTQRMLVYLNDGVIGSGSNGIRLRDWKIGDMAAINDSTFLVLEAAARGTTDIKRVYKININNATAVHSGLYGGQSLEALADSAGLAFQGIQPVQKTLFMDLLANGWNPAYEKAEGIAIVNDSTIFIGNDNDYGQFSPLENGVAQANNILSHVLKFSLSGNKKLNNFNALTPTLSQGITATHSSRPPYIIPQIPQAKFTSILSVGDKAPNNYEMVGIPDGLGHWDNGNGTFTVLMNHELGGTQGAVRAHGVEGSFVSKWVINKNNLSVVSGADLVQNVHLWNPVTNSYNTYNASNPSPDAAFNRLCSADLPAVSAFYNSITGKGTTERIFMNGEESGAEGRAFGHIATGAAAGNSYELPYLGKFSWENSVACPTISDTTIVVGTDDATGGQVYVYVGTKTNTGNDIEKAGLSNGRLYGIAVANYPAETNAAPPTNATFTMADMGQVHNMSGATLQTQSAANNVTAFLRPEDAAWDPSSPNDLYFATTNGMNRPSRLWRLRFNDVRKPLLGGTIEAVLDGTEGQQMFDNLTIDNTGKIILQEDPGGNNHIAKIWQYDIATDVLTLIAAHDSTYFKSPAAQYLTNDEESSGIVEAQDILGPGMFLADVQAHYGIPGALVQGGQLLAFYNPATAASNPTAQLLGNNILIENGDLTPSATDNTDFGFVSVNDTLVKNFTIKNTGAGKLTITEIYFDGANGNNFKVINTSALPVTVAPNGSTQITVRFIPNSTGTKTAMLHLTTTDYLRKDYKVAVKGAGALPEIKVSGNGQVILDNDMTPGTNNNTDFGNVVVNNNTVKSFVISNTGVGKLKVSAIAISGTNASEFVLQNTPTLPLNIDSGASVTVNVKFTPTALGVRSAKLQINNSDNTKAVYDFAIQGRGVTSTSVNNIPSFASAATLYPNPASNKITISFDIKQAVTVYPTVLDMQGKVIEQHNATTLNVGQQNVNISVAKLTAGNYIVVLHSDKGDARFALSVVK